MEILAVRRRARAVEEQIRGEHERDGEEDRPALLREREPLLAHDGAVPQEHRHAENAGHSDEFVCEGQRLTSDVVLEKETNRLVETDDPQRHLPDREHHERGEDEHVRPAVEPLTLRDEALLSEAELHKRRDPLGDPIPPDIHATMKQRRHPAAHGPEEQDPVGEQQCAHGVRIHRTIPMPSGRASGRT